MRVIEGSWGSLLVVRWTSDGTDGGRSPLLAELGDYVAEGFERTGREDPFERLVKGRFPYDLSETCGDVRQRE
jgi:hypothetical protein